MIKLKEISEQDLGRLAGYLPTQPRFSLTTQETWERRFDIWWTSNPAFTLQFSRGWVLEDETSIVGFIGSVPVKFLIRGEEKTAVAAVAWYVDPSVRGISSIGMLSAFAKQDNASLYLFNTDKEDLMKLLFKMKFKKYVLPRYQTKYFFILKPSTLITILIRLNILKKVYNFPSLLKMLKEIGSFINAYMHQKHPVRLNPPQENKFRTSLCTSCDESFARIWESSRDGCDVSLSRDTKTLNWIYFSSILPSERVVIQCRRADNNLLAGYMVFDLQRFKPTDTPLMRLMDVCIEGNDPEVLSSLLEAATETARQRNAAALELWATDDEMETYLQNRYAIRIPYRHHNLYRLPDIPGLSADSLILCPSMIAPPRGIDH